ncbi:MAG: hypothetical protein ACPHN3_00675 [Spongiibacter sp.]
MTSEGSATGKKQLTVILAIPIVVIALSSLLFVLAQKNILNFSTVNRGTLIVPPVQMEELHLKRTDGSEFLFDQVDSKWVWAVVGGQTCTGPCERMLYLTRQTHVALGKKTGRVERVYIALDGRISAELRDFLDAEHSDLTVLYADGPDYMQALSHMSASPRDDRSFYVIDPLGWMMMAYRAQDTEQDTLTALGKDVLKDMKRLLK